MKRHTLLFLSMLLFGSTGLLRAQNEVLHFFDDFESTTLKYWTDLDADGDGWSWQTGCDGDEGNFFAISVSYDHNPDNYLITPLLEGVGMITFDVSSAGEGAYFQVGASSTGMDPNNFTAVYDASCYHTAWEEVVTFLPEDTKYVAIRHYGGSLTQGGLKIDNVKIWGNESNCIYSIDVDGFTQPHWGAHPDFDITIAANSHCSISDVRWFWESDSNMGEMTPSSTFNHEDYVYYMAIFFTPETGYHFADYTRVYYNGNPGPFDIVYSSIVSGGDFRAWTKNYHLYDPMGVDEQVTEHKLIVRPNPTSDKLYLENMDGELVSVYDNTGRMVLQEHYHGSLNVSNLPKGVYVITIAGRTMNNTVKFTKE